MWTFLALVFNLVTLMILLMINAFVIKMYSESIEHELEDSIEGVADKDGLEELLEGYTIRRNEFILFDENGKAKDSFLTWSYIRQSHPRTAIEYYEPGHYCLLLVDGRHCPFMTFAGAGKKQRS